jgi:hypothetical protein
MIASWCYHGLRRGMSGDNVVLMGLLGSMTGTLGDGGVGEVRFSTLGIGSIILGVGSCCGAIFSNIAANSLNTCILSDPGCLNGVHGAGWMSVWERSAATMVAASTLDRPGTLQFWGMASMVSKILSCPVVEQYTRRQQ